MVGNSLILLVSVLFLVIGSEVTIKNSVKVSELTRFGKTTIGFINITIILGLALIASPLDVNIAAFTDLARFSLIVNLFLWYFMGSIRIGWREGALFLALYAAFLVTSFGGFNTQRWIQRSSSRVCASTFRNIR